MSVISPSTAGNLVELLGNGHARQTALIVPETDLRLTYAALRSEVQSVAEQLAAAGVSRGDRVAMALPNGLPMVMSFLGASAVATAAPLNPAYLEEEFRFYLDDTAATVLLVPPGEGEQARRGASDRVRILEVDMDGSSVVLFDRAERVGRAAVTAPRSSDIALVLHTSGSTGRPKRVPLTHANISISAANIAQWYALGESDVSLCVMPLFHVHGLVASTLSTFARGGTVVVPKKFNPLSFWRTAREHRVTWYSAVPTLHQLLLARVGSASQGRPLGTEQLRFIRSCSAALAPRVMHALESTFGAPVLEAYGMTEAAHQMTSNPLPPLKRKAGSVGLGTNVRVSIMDAHGAHCRPGERGEVVIQGPNVISGYENNPEANHASFVDGWFRTGDRGYLDSDGYLTLVARIKELINRGGEKISPREIDEVLLAHPAVAEAVSFGVPHPTWGEEVEAAVVLREEHNADEATLVAYCREHLADFKRPKRVHVTTAIPRTATGKIQRGVVARAYAKKSS